MLRRILISLGVFLIFLPHLGFPHAWQSVMLSVSGLLIVVTLLFARRKRSAHLPSGERHDDAQALHVERMEVIERPLVHVERETVIDTEHTQESSDTETTVEKKVTVLRKRRKHSMTPADPDTPPHE